MENGNDYAVDTAGRLTVNDRFSFVASVFGRQALRASVMRVPDGYSSTLFLARDELLYRGLESDITTAVPSLWRR